MHKFLGYTCSLCGKDYGADFEGYVCPEDGGNLTVRLDVDRIRKETKPEQIFASNERSLWRYEPLLPVQDPGFADTPIHTSGWTPVFRTERTSAT